MENWEKNAYASKFMFWLKWAEQNSPEMFFLGLDLKLTKSLLWWLEQINQFGSHMAEKVEIGG